MDSEAVHSSQVNENEQYQPQNGGLQQEEQQSGPEKKSVLNKVKAKAKKIKDTIKKHGQQVLDQYGRENSSNEDQNSPVGHDMDEDEIISQDQPVDESDKNAPLTYEQVENLDKSGVDSGGGKTVMGEEHHQEPRVVGASPITTESETSENIGIGQGKTFTVEEMPGNLEKPRGFDEDTQHTQGIRSEAYATSNYQTKNTDPTTGTVDDVKIVPQSVGQVKKIATPASEQVENLDELGVDYGGKITVKGGQPHQEPRIACASPIMKTDENIATEPAKTFAGEEKKPGQGEINLERPKDFDEDMYMPERGPGPYTPLNHQTKFTDPTETGRDVIDITPVEKSFGRMNVQDEPKPVPEPKVLSDSGETQYPDAESQGQFVPKPGISSANKTQYTPPESHDQNFPELSSATDTRYPSKRSNDQYVPEFSTATTETQYPSGETHHDKFAPDTTSKSTNSNKKNPEVTEQTFNSTTGTVEEQPKYESEDKPSKQGSYTDDKWSTTSVIADKSVSVENAVKILEEEKIEDASKKSSGSTLGYGKNIASSVTENVAPVYGKVAGMGNAVKSEVSGTRTGDNSVGVETEKNVGKEQDKDVSVKNYLAEKLKPGEEDKALSEVISQTLYKQKEESNKVPEDEDRDVTIGDDSSDAIKKQETQPVEKEHGKSEESYVNNSPGKSVVGKIKGVVGSWFGKSEENQSSQVAGGDDLPKNKNNSGEVEQVGRTEAERILQE